MIDTTMTTARPLVASPSFYAFPGRSGLKSTPPDHSAEQCFAAPRQQTHAVPRPRETRRRNRAGTTMARRHRHRQYHFRRTDRRTRAVQRPTGEPGNHSIVLVTEAGRGRNRWPIAARDWRRDDPSSSGRMVKAARRPWLEALSSVRSRTARQDQNNCPPETERRKSDSPVSGVHTRRQRVKRSRTTAAFVARSRHMRGLGECVVGPGGLEPPTKRL